VSPPTSPGDDPDLTVEPANGQPSGRTVGPYRLLRPLGEGGMGEVWLADQTAPMRRQVAIKIIKAGMDTAQVVARFEAERQALALMDHPAIARVIDAGATDDRRPYFAMEYVKGDPITTYAVRHRLSIADRLKLFIQVCEGVQHAHQKGVIHRDLKPSNVLVTMTDGAPVPKIIDFGVAKATTHHLTDTPLYTEVGAFVGTPEYMSPEQADLSSLDIDTRADIYALGVILYELLTGQLPFDRTALRQRGLDEIRRVIRDVDPPRPSTRLSTMARDAATADAMPQADLRVRVKQVKGDLDWITMKALEKDRARRYESAVAMAQDVRRHLHDEPVAAGPPSTTYRAGKFVRRHRFGVAVAGGAAVVLVSVAVGVAEQARRIAVERDRANEASTRASQEAEGLRRVSDFLVRLFELSDPSETRGSAITAREILDTGASRIDRELANQPALQSRLLGTMGTAYQNLGLYPAAETLFRRALEVRRSSGSDELSVAAALHDLGYQLIVSGRLPEAEPVLKEALAIRERAAPSTAALADTIGALGELAYMRADYPTAQALYQRRVDMLRSLPEPPPESLADSLTELATAVQRTSENFALATALNEEALALRRRTVAAPHQRIAESINNLAMVHYRQNAYDKAEPLFRESLAMNRQLFGADHPEVTANLNNLGLVARDRGDYASADEIFGQVVMANRRQLGPSHIQVGRSLNNWAESVRRSGNLARAEQLFRESVGIHAAALSPTHWQTAATQMLLARTLVAQRRYLDAERQILEAYPSLVKEFGPTNARTRAAAERAVELYDAWKRPDKSAEWRARLAPAQP
jgi:eukaryotic-like serine/threonine-protein kinase